MSLPVQLEDWIAHWCDLAAGDPRLIHLGRDCTMDLCWQIDDQPWFFEIERGRVVAAVAGPFHMRRADLTFSGPRTSWEKFFSAEPPPGFHDLFAMSSYFHIEMTGNTDLLREHLAYLKALMQLPRAAGVTCE